MVKHLFKCKNSKARCGQCLEIYDLNREGFTGTMRVALLRQEFIIKNQK